MTKIIVTGAAGLVGQNVIARLKGEPGITIVGIDKHPANTALLRRLHPQVEVIEADLAVEGPWMDVFAGADAVLLNQAQIGGLEEEEFVANNVTATQLIVSAMRRHAVPYFVHISSSVVNSKADDFYTRTKTTQERFIDTVTDIAHVVLRPTLMFGWFDRKHLGWLRRFMDRTPVFPIPYRLFWWLLFVYGKFSANPPFTTNQLEALVIPETFPVIDWPAIFGVTATPLGDAIRETYLDARYSSIVLDF